MKKRSLIKNVGIKTTTMLLCLATSATCLTVAALPAMHKASADEVPASVTPVEIVKDLNLVDSCEYGKTFTVPAGAKVTAPDGTNVEGTTVTAWQVGNYKVSFEKDKVSYDFFVKVRLDEEFFLKVDYNGADIPTYLKTDGSFTLPDAKVMYYDDNNILQEYKGGYTVTATDSRGGNYTFGENGKREFSADKTSGKVYFTYDAVLGGDAGSKHFSKTFGVNVQSTIPAAVNPTLSVSGVQKDVSINRAVTLPVATVDESVAEKFDDNVKVVVEVTKDGEAVTNVDIDDNGYAYKAEGKDYDAVVFDNDKAMTFYPTETGTYKVTYTAYNDAYTDGGTTGKSSTREYYITVSDLVAPVFKNVDEYLIPETWGLTVKDGKGETVANSGKVKFTVPEVVDNNGKDDITVYFRITDSDNSKTIVEFTNILADNDSDDCKFKANSVYGQDGITYSFNKDNPFEFDFNQYKKTNSSGEKQALPGTYTVLYRARDKANNTSSRTFTITLQDTYTDDAAPTTAEVTVPDYISAADKTFTIPQASVADAADSRLKKVYRVYNAKGDFIDVDGGEVADIEKPAEGARKLVINKGKTTEKSLELDTALYFYVSAQDKAGNFKSNVKGNLDLTVEENKNKFTDCEASLIVVSDNASNKPVYSGTNMKLTSAGTITAGDNVKFGGFSIGNTSDMRYYTGFEVAARDPQGNAIATTLETVSTDDGQGMAVIYVQNISFNVASATTGDEFYYVTVRVFDVNGNNSVYGYKLTGVNPSDDDNISTSAINTIGTSGEVNTTYKLNNVVISGIPGASGDKFRVARKIQGSVFALMGNEFTAKTQSSYRVTDGYVNDADIDATAGTFKGFKDVDTYNFTITDTAAPTLEVLGVMPTYQDFDKVEGEVTVKSAKVVLPKIVAYTENGEAKVTIEVKDPNNGDVKVEEDEQHNKYFTATIDGEYKVTATATYANAAPASATYNISIGDVVGPEFELSGDALKKLTATVGDEFTFAVMKLANEDEKDTVTIQKRLRDPSKEDVSSATISGSYNNNAAKEKNTSDTKVTFDMAGEYTVVYTATDSNNNVTTQSYTITVVSKGSGTPTTWTTLSTVLIVVAVVLLAGVIIYVVRFRKVKK